MKPQVNLGIFQLPFLVQIPSQQSLNVPIYTTHLEDGKLDRLYKKDSTKLPKENTLLNFKFPRRNSLKPEKTGIILK